MSKRTGRLAQLVRAPPLQGGGRWFESNTAHFKTAIFLNSGFFLAASSYFACYLNSLAIKCS